MAQATTVVTPARFAKGFSFKDYLSQIKVNKDKFEEYYGTAAVSRDEAAFFKKAVSMPGGAAKVLVLGEDWCPDVFRGLPVITKIAEASGMELRMFPRDANLDIMNEFLNQGQFQSIPTVVFYTKDVKYITHWIERPAFANEERAKITEQVKKEKPSLNEQDFRAEMRTRTTPRYPAWQQATVKEIQQLLAKTLKVK
jgi:Thioredoxin